METLYLLDGYGLFYRSYFAFARTPMKNSHGVNVSAVFGFYRTLLAILKTYKPHSLALVLDPAGPTFRSDIYPEYKATRQATPDDLKAQFPVLEDAARALGIQILRSEGFEADDVIATMSRRAREHGWECRIISADKDLMQLILPGVSMLKPSKDGGFDLVGPEEVFADKGVRPDQIADYLSLLGDSSDNVPGVSGVGDKTASKLLADFGSLDELYADLSRVNPLGLRNKLEVGRENAYLSKRLICLKTDVPGYENPDFASYATSRLDGRLVSKFFLDQGLKLLGSDYAKLESTDVTAEDTITAEVPIRSYDAQVQNYTLIDSLDKLKVMSLELETAEWLCFDTETEGLDAHNDALCGLSFCARAGRAFYLALRGPGGRQKNSGTDLDFGDEASASLPGTILDWEDVKPYVCDLLTAKKHKLIAQNGKFDIQMLYRYGLEIETLDFDTMLAAWVCDSTRNIYNMDALALDLLNYKTISYTDLFSTEDKLAAKKDPERMKFSLIPLEKAAVYSAEDADITFQLYQSLAAKLEEQKLRNLFDTVEMPLVPLLARMEYHGMHIDSEELRQYSQELESRLAIIEKDLYELVGHPFNINSTKQLQEILFVERKLKSGKKTKTGFSTDISVLEELARQDPVPAKVLEHRSLNKLKSTYVDTLPLMVNRTSGRIHTSFVQTGTATGRISSKDPNLQNIPVKDEDGRRIRRAFTAAEGKCFVSADYAQIELVVMAHLADDPGLQEAFSKGLDVHKLTASRLFGCDTSAVSPEQRRIAKTINFGVLYGMSAFRLSNELGISNREAADFIKSYFDLYPAIKTYIAQQVERCEAEGGVHTLAGRWRPIPAIRSANKTEKQAAERIAVNTPIQGTAADIVKLAMVRLDKRLQKEGLEAKLILQVHDELIIEAPFSEVEKVKQLCTEELPRAMDLRVPLTVSVESATRWGDMH